MDVKFIVTQNNIQSQYSLSQKFIDKLSEMGFTIIETLGEGASNLVLKARNVSNENYALIINKNNDCKLETVQDVNYGKIQKMQKDGTLSYDYMIKIYDSINIRGVKLSDDNGYCPYMGTSIIHIEVQEIAPKTLGQKISELYSYSVRDRVMFAYELKKRLRLMYDYFAKKNMYYNDLQSGNLAFMDEYGNIKNLIFIDLESFIFNYNGGYLAVNEFMKTLLSVISDQDNMDLYYDNKDWNYFDAIFLSENEKSEGMKIYNTLK